MKNSVTNYFTSYRDEVYRPYEAWCKDHWKGMVVSNVVTYGAIIGVVIIHEKDVDKINTKLKKIIKK